MKRASALCIQSQPMRFYYCQFIQDFLFEWKKIESPPAVELQWPRSSEILSRKRNKKKNDQD